jgi:hypothetical protein
MRGVLKPAAHNRDSYSQVVPLQDNPFYASGQYSQQQPQEQHVEQQQQQQNTWPAAPETPYYPSAGAYGTVTSSAQCSKQNNGGYAPSNRLSTALQATPYTGYDPSSDSYTYPDLAQASTYTPRQRAGASEDPVSPSEGSSQKHNRMLNGQRYQNTVQDLEELMGMLQAEIDASFVDGVHECCKSELTLGGGALVPLMRPNIGPYADGGKQDLPTEYKTNFPPLEAPKVNEPSQSQQDDQAESQMQTQDPPQQDANASGTQPRDGPSETQRSASSSTTQPTSSKSTPAIPEPEDPLKRCPRATVDTVINITDPDLRAIIQRAASRGLVQRIVNLDGYKYMFNNYWTSRIDGDGMRYSYICRDSLQNKDRFSHVPTRPTTAAPSNRGPMPRRTKESWDCKGSISIKFSKTVGAIIIQYRHTAMHPTHASRKRPPRKPAAPRADSQPRRPGGLVGTKRKRAGASATVPEPMPFTGPKAPEPSLFELLQQSAIESQANKEAAQLGDASRPWWSNS